MESCQWHLAPYCFCLRTYKVICLEHHRLQLKSIQSRFLSYKTQITGVKEEEDRLLAEQLRVELASSGVSEMYSSSELSDWSAEERSETEWTDTEDDKENLPRSSNQRRVSGDISRHLELPSSREQDLRIANQWKNVKRVHQILFGYTISGPNISKNWVTGCQVIHCHLFLWFIMPSMCCLRYLRDFYIYRKLCMKHVM